MRVSLWEVIQSLRMATKRIKRDPLNTSSKDWQGFAIAFCAAEIIVGTSEYLIDLARDRPIIWRKCLYRQLTSAFHMHGFYRACDIFDAYREKILTTAPTQISEILTTLNLPTASRGDHLRRYHRFVRHSLNRRHISAARNILFSVFFIGNSKTRYRLMPSPLYAQS